MNEPPSLIVGTGEPVVVVGADEQSDVEVDVDRWCALAAAVLRDCDLHGELTLTFVDRVEIADLNEQHLGKSGPTDVLSFPLDAEAEELSARSALDSDAVPTLLGDVVICPDVARTQAPTHAGSLDDELALLVVHGVLHVLGLDHAEAGQAEAMRARELELLVAHHWGSPPPPAFHQVHE
jgi:probable rRNA maturation factor